MDKKELMEYLKDAYELESQLYTLNRLKEEYENTYEDLKFRKTEPLYIQEEFDGTGKKSDKEYHLRDQVYIGDDVYGHYCHSSNIRKSWITPKYEELYRKYDLQKSRNRRNEYDNEIITVAIPVICGITSLILCYKVFHFDALPSLIVGVVLFFIGMIFFAWCMPSPLKDNHSAKEPLRSYIEICYKKDAKAKAEWYEQRIHIVSTEYKEIVIQNIVQTEKTLEKVYEKNYIHPKYRNLVAISQIYEYLDTSRCNELEGPDGAYNLFESELRQNIIITKLDRIIEQLDELNATMYYLTRMVGYTNTLLGSISRELGNISSSLNLIENNTALTAYNTQCISFNAELMRRYN